MLLISLLVYLIVSFTVGIILIALPFNLDKLRLLANYIEIQMTTDPNNILICGLFGILIILTCLWLIHSVLVKSRKDKSITFDAADGKVSITFFALEDMLKKLLEERTEISHTKPKVIVKKKELLVNVKTNLAEEVNLLEFTNEVQGKIKEKLENLLGEDKNIKINIEIRKMRFKGGANREDIEEEEEEPEVPFRNY